MAEFIKTPEKRRIIEELNKLYGITDLPYLLIETGKEKIRGFSGTLSKDEILELGKIANIEIVGIYLARRETYLRLSFDATHMLASQITKGILELENEDEVRRWMKGEDLNKKAEKGIYVVKWKEDYLGCGKSNGEILFNHVPKDRRLRK